jgi:phosphoribosylformimino-5-aminoimidazole carboxamide ribotide isomerase
VDARDGRVATSGWTETTDVSAEDAIRHLSARGVRSFVYTSVDRDGGLAGPDVEEVRRIADAVRGRFLYSGGIGSLEHLRALHELRQVNLAGVIAGKALYEARFTVAEGQAALDGRAEAA